MKIKVIWDKIRKNHTLPEGFFEADILYETEKAICINYSCNGSLNKIWLPKSQIIYKTIQ